MYGLIFHGNLQYAEIPKSEIPKVLKKSYIVTLKSLLHAEIPFALNITGFSIKILPKEIIFIIKEGIESNLIEITGTSYTHAILPLLKLSRVEKQIVKDLKVKEEILDCAPKTFWPPELAYDPVLPAILKDLNFTNVFVDGEALLFSKYMNTNIQKWKIPYTRLILASRGEKRFSNYLRGLPKLKKSLSYVFSGRIELRGVKNIMGIPIWQPVNITLLLALGEFPLMNEKRASKWLKSHDNIMLYGTDLEFFGYMPFGGKIMKIERLISIIKKNSWKIDLPSKIPHSGKLLYLKTSSWAPDKSLKIWKDDEDNERLTVLSQDMDGEYAFLAENSDARGWVPIPERRLDAFKAIYKDWREKNE